MTDQRQEIEELADASYEYGFTTDLDTDIAPPGLDEDTIRLISSKKNEPDWLLEWRLKAYEAWTSMEEPDWAKLEIEPIDYQSLSYWAAPKQKPVLESMDEVDPEIREMFDKLGIPLHEQKMLSNVAVDAIVDSVSVTTTFKETLAEAGVIFCSFTEAVHDHPDLVREHLGSVVPVRDNFFAALNSAVFSDGSFCYIPAGVRCPMELSTYFRINSQNTGQFERTLIVAEDDSHVSYLEGCTAPMRDENQLHAAVVELVAKDRAEIKYSTVQNWYPGDENGVGGIYNFVTKRGDCRGTDAKISWTQVETGSAITWKYPSVILQGDNSVGEFYSVALSKQAPAGRHRHQDDPPRQEHHEHDHLQGDLGRHRARTPTAASSRPSLGAENARATTPSATRCSSAIRLRRPHLPLHRGQEPDGQGRARGHHVEDQRGSAVLLPPARHEREDAVS